MPEVIDIWIQRLRDPDMARRREAIHQLEVMGDPAALGPLAVIFALDPDLETRRLAQVAGKAIYMGIERRAAGVEESSEDERRKAAEILAKAQSKKNR